MESETTRDCFRECMLIPFVFIPVSGLMGIVVHVVKLEWVMGVDTLEGVVGVMMMVVLVILLGIMEAVFVHVTPEPMLIDFTTGNDKRVTFVLLKFSFVVEILQTSLTLVLSLPTTISRFLALLDSILWVLALLASLLGVGAMMGKGVGFLRETAMRQAVII